MADNYKLTEADNTQSNFRATDTGGVKTPHHVIATPNGTSAIANGQSLATDGVLQAVRDRLPNALNVDGSFKVGVQAAVENALTSLNTKTPSNPASDRTTASAPFAMRLSDGTSFLSALPVTQSGTWNFSVTGVATEATLAGVSAKLPTLAGGRIPITTDGLTDAQLRATALPVTLSGVSTAANQVTANTSLQSILDKLSSDPATATNQSSQTTVLNTISTRSQTGNNLLTSIDTKLPSDPALQGAPMTGEVVGTGGTGLLGWLSTIRKLINDKLPALVAGKIPVDNGLQQALTDAQLRASAVPISGTVTANLGTIGGISLETTQSAINAKLPPGLTVSGNRLLVDGVSQGASSPAAVARTAVTSGLTTSQQVVTARAGRKAILIDNRTGAEVYLRFDTSSNPAAVTVGGYDLRILAGSPSVYLEQSVGSAIQLICGSGAVGGVNLTEFY